MNSAIKLKNVGFQTLYSVDPPLLGFKFVVASPINNDYGHETYLFGSDEHGVVLDYNELPGSSKSHTDTARAIRDAGYSVVEVAGE